MPEIKTQTKVINLPEYQDAKITLRSSIKSYLKFASEYKEGEQNIEASLKLLISVIESWNLQEGGEDLPITQESIEKLDIESFNYLVKKVTDFVSGEKKTE